ncbi:MAG: SAF domain-containing protein [Acidimicrobiia bacterium]
MAVADLSRAIPRVRLDRRTLVGLTAAASAALLVLLLTRPGPAVPILVAADDIPAGVPLGETGVETRLVPSAEGLVAGDALGDLSDWTLAVPLRAGEPLLPSLLRPPERQAAPDVMALALEESHAAFGRVDSGDLVDLYVTWPPAADQPSRTELLAAAVYVVEAQPGGSGPGGRPELALLVAVDDTLAGQLASALRGGEIDLVRVGP